MILNRQVTITPTATALRNTISNILTNAFPGLSCCLRIFLYYIFVTLRFGYICFYLSTHSLIYSCFIWFILFHSIIIMMTSIIFAPALVLQSQLFDISLCAYTRNITTYLLILFHITVVIKQKKFLFVQIFKGGQS